MANPPLRWLLFYHYKGIEWERKEGHIHDHTIEVQVDCHMKEKVTEKTNTGFISNILKETGNQEGMSRQLGLWLSSTAGKI